MPPKRHKRKATSKEESQDSAESLETETMRLSMPRMLLKERRHNFLQMTKTLLIF